MENQLLTWEVGHSRTAAEEPSQFYPATVPGAVQLDMMAALRLPDYRYGDHVRQYRWMEDCYWLYRTRTCIEEVPGHIPHLVLESVEYAYTVRIDGREVGRGEGLYTPFELDLSSYAGREIRLEVLIAPSPRRPELEVQDSRQASASCKPPFSYGWDWCPRLVSLGLCGPAYIDYRPAARIAGWDIAYTLDADLQHAQLQIGCRPTMDGTVIFTLYRGSTPVYVQQEAVRGGASVFFGGVFAHPDLWWPAGQGDQALYRAELTLRSPGQPDDTHTRPIGFRRVRLVMNEGAWDRVQSFPQTRSTPPITIEINGRRIFAKGSNWVPPAIFPSEITREVVEPPLALARDAHMNLLRLWGGGYVNPPVFYDLCDAYGILVWQEFPLACNAYPDDPDYLRVLDQESRSILDRLQGHPCLAIWCGGNELFNTWSRMTDQSLALRLLNRNCLERDPYTPFLPTSPLYGMGHGHYEPMDRDGREAVTLFYEAQLNAYTEFGCAAPSPWAYLQTFLPEDELLNPAPGGSWELHHAFHAWATEDTWFSPQQIERFMGKAEDLPDLVEKGGELQALMYRQLFEEARMQWPACSFALNWCFNEPWPTAAGNSLLNYPARPKPCYAAVREALKPRKLSLRLPRLRWKPGETVEARVYLLNDSPEAVEAGGTVTVWRLFPDASRTKLAAWEFPGGPALRHVEGPAFTFPLEAEARGRVHLLLTCDAHPDWESQYTLLCVTADG